MSSSRYSSLQLGTDILALCMVEFHAEYGLAYRSVLYSSCHSSSILSAAFISRRPTSFLLIRYLDKAKRECL